MPIEYEEKAVSEVTPLEILNTFFKGLTGQAAGTAAQTARSSLGVSQALEASASTAAATEAETVLADLKEQGYTLSAEESQRISEFIEKTEGTTDEKLQTVKSALDKGLPLTLRALEAVRTALFGQAIPKELLQQLTEAATFSQERAAVLNALSALAVTETASPTQAPTVIQNLVTEPMAETDLAAALAQLTADTESAEPQEAFQWLLKAVAQLTSLAERFELPEESPAPVAGQKPDPVPEVTAALPEEPPEKEAVPDAARHAVGPEHKGPQRAAEKTAPAEGSSETEDAEAPESALELLEDAAAQWEAGNRPEAMQAAQQGMLLLVREVTPKIAAVRTEFETVRRNVRQALANVQEALPQTGTVDRKKAEEGLAKAIEGLDKALLKSDIPLYTSMKTEKQLLTWSSDLQEARRLLQTGEDAKAAEIVSKISNGLDKLKFEPANLKVIHQAAKSQAYAEEILEHGASQRVQQQLDRVLSTIRTPREVLEAFKALGLTHESEVVGALSQGNRKQKDDWQPQENLKEILMKLAAESQEKLTTVTAAEKTLSGLTGQQLLNRPEAKQQQTLFFSLPMTLADRVEELKIYVQSRKETGKVDWENCTFYFAVHTEKYGDVGIRLAAVRKSVAIQVKCDDRTLREAIGPMVEDFKKTMAETGYRIAGVSYSPLAEQKAARAESQAPSVDSVLEEGGLNLRV